MREETYDIYGIRGSSLGDIGTSGGLIIFQHVLLADVHLAFTCTCVHVFCKTTFVFYCRLINESNLLFMLFCFKYVYFAMHERAWR